MDLVYWIWLSLRCGAGSELGSYLLRHFNTPKEIYEADRLTLQSIDGINEDILAALLDRDLSLSYRILEYCERVNVGIMTAASPVYPDRLRNIHAKPLLLYYRGRIPDIDDNVLIACVGTRKCSAAGIAAAKRLGTELARAGAVVVSGMALGIDTAAHEGALAAGGHTIAVLGCGIDRVYPLENRKLMEAIAERGTLMTEYAPGSDPDGKHFPIRNRILSGLCQGTVVVEADPYSGSLITARAARKQGRDLFAFPGNPEDRRAQGTNMLIREGAKLVTCAADILDEYELLYPHRIFTERIPRRSSRLGRARSAPVAAEKESRPAFVQAKNSGKTVGEDPAIAKTEQSESLTLRRPRRRTDTESLGEWERTVLFVISETMSAEEIAAAVCRRTGACDMGALLSALTMLEISGFLLAEPGGNYRPL